MVDAGLVFNGNSDQNTAVKTLFQQPVNARYVRIYPQSWQDHMSMRAGIIKVPTPEPTEAADAGDNVVVDLPYGSLSASSVYANHPIGKGRGSGRLDSTQGWSAWRSAIGQWFGMDAGGQVSLAGVVTKGRTQYSQWVKSFKVSVSLDKSAWTDVDSGVVFNGIQTITPRSRHCFSSQ
jgi:hypothetical protein